MSCIRARMWSLSAHCHTLSGASGGSSGAEVSRKAFGHTGYTGTSLWVDPESKTWTVLLTNRTFDPHASNRIQALRRAVNDRVAQAAELADAGGGLLAD